MPPNVKKIVRSQPTKTGCGINEPIRKTLYDNLRKNLRIGERKTFLHRVIYIGVHGFVRLNVSSMAPADDTAVSPDPIVVCFKRAVDKVNESYNTLEKLTGFLLYYPSYFIHLIEGDERSIHKHLKLIINSDDINYIYKMKLLVDLAQINSRYVNDWNYYFGIPKKLVDTTIQQTGPTVTGWRVTQTIIKLYTFITENYQSYDTSGTSVMDTRLNSVSTTHSELPLSSSLRLIGTQSSIYQYSLSSSSMNPALRDPLRTYMIETEILDYLMASEDIRDIVDYVKLYGYIPQRDVYKDKVWPPPEDLVQFDVFDGEYDRDVMFPHKTLNRNRSDVKLREDMSLLTLQNI